MQSSAVTILGWDICVVGRGVMAASLETILTDNGLGKWFATLAAEEVDIDTITEMTEDDLEKIGVSLMGFYLSA